MKTRKLFALVLTAMMLLALTLPAFADEAYSITVKNANTSITIKDNTYKAYKVFDVTYSTDENGAATGYAYTIADAWKDFFAGDGSKYLADTDSTGKLNAITIKNGDGSFSTKYINITDGNVEQFSKDALKYVTSKSLTPDGTTTADSYEKSGDVETMTIALAAPGYYLVTGTATAPDEQTVTAACSLTTTNPTAEITVKADAPSIDKKIVEGEKKVDANTANVGEAVNYEITSKVPNMTGYTKYFFVMKDTLSKGLTYNEDIVVKINGATLTKDTDYTVSAVENADGTTSLEIVFKNFANNKSQAGADIVVTYSATVNQDAELDPTVGNPNEVKLIYSNNPNVEGEGEPENPDKPKPGTSTGETPVAKTQTYVTGLKLVKIDGTTKAKLTGAKFEIKGEGSMVVLINKEVYKVSENGTYYMLKDGTYTTTAPQTDKDSNGYNADQYDSVTVKYEKVTEVVKETVSAPINATGYVDANGVLTFEGLGEGTYTITEIIAPAGYNLLKDPITVVITAEETLNGCTWTVKIGDKTLSAVDNHLYVFEVENKSGSTLPSTGGMGTTLFYVLGALLAVGAGVLLATRKKMSAESR